MKTRDKININTLLKILFLCLVGIRIILFMKMPLVTNGSSPHDNMLSINLAKNIVEGKWLGAYDEFTLIKRLSYPIYLAVINLVGISYGASLGLFYTLALAVFVMAFKPMVANKKVLGIIYLFFLYSPVTFSVDMTERIYRTGIVVPTLLLFTGALAGMYFRRNKSILTVIKWGIIAGLSLGFFWNIREDSLYMLPFAAGGCVIMAIQTAYANRKNIKKLFARVAVSFIPLMLLASFNAVISGINYANYGVYTICELDDSNFADMIQLMYSIKSSNTDDGIWVAHETVDKLIDYCPSVASIESQINEMYESRWQVRGDGKDDNEMAAGFFMWGMRDALKSAGMFENGHKLNDYCGKVISEINAAFASGKLEKNSKSRVSFVSFEMNKSTIDKLVKDSLEEVKWTATYEKMYSEGYISSGDLNGLRLSEKIIGEPLTKSEYYTELTCSGWVFLTDERSEITITVEDDEFNVKKVIKEKDLGESPNVSSIYPEYKNAEKCMFSFKLPINSIVKGNNRLCIYSGNVMIGAFSLSDLEDGYIKTSGELPGLLYSIDSINTSSLEDGDVDMYSGYIKQADRLIEVYKKTGLVTAVLAVILFIIDSVFVIFVLGKKRGNLLDMWFIALGAAVSYAALIVGVALSYINAIDKGKRYTYLAGAYPLQGIFIVISTVLFVKIVQILLKSKKNKGKTDSKI